MDPSPPSPPPSEAAWSSLRAWLGGPGPRDAAPFGEIAAAARIGHVVRLAAAASPDLEEELRPDVERSVSASLAHAEAEQVLAAACEGYRVVLIKGSATSRLLYADPTLRDPGDVDVLVADDALEPILERLIAGGAQESTVASLRWGMDRPHQRVADWCRPKSTVSLDVHRRLQRWDLPDVDHEELLDGAIAHLAAPLPVPRPEHALLIALVHAANDAYASDLKGWVDVAGLCRGESLDWGLVLRTAERWRARTLTWTGLRIAERWLSAPVPGGIWTALAPPAAAIPMLDALIGGRGRSPSTHHGRANRLLLPMILRDGIKDRVSHAWKRARFTAIAQSSRLTHPSGDAPSFRNGIPVLPPRKGEPAVTIETVNGLRDGDEEPSSA